MADAALVFAVAGEGDADGVADPLRQQDAHAYAGADGAAEGRARLGDAQVEGVVHLLRQQPVGLHRAHHVAGLEADLDVVETLALQHLDVAQGALHHGLGRGGAELLQQVLLQAAAVDADADGDALLAGLVHHGPHAVLAADVARVDAQAGGAAVGGHQGQPVVEVDVGHHGDGAAGADLVEDLAGLLGGYAHPHDLAAGAGVVVDLVDGGLDVPGVRLRHALHGDGGVPAHGHLAHQDLAGAAAGGEGLENGVGHGASISSSQCIRPSRGLRSGRRTVQLQPQELRMVGRTSARPPKGPRELGRVDYRTMFKVSWRRVLAVVIALEFAW